MFDVNNFLHDHFSHLLGGLPTGEPAVLATGPVRGHRGLDGPLVLGRHLGEVRELGVPTKGRGDKSWLDTGDVYPKGAKHRALGLTHALQGEFTSAVDVVEWLAPHSANTANVHDFPTFLGPHCGQDCALATDRPKQVGVELGLHGLHGQHFHRTKAGVTSVVDEDIDSASGLFKHGLDSSSDALVGVHVQVHDCDIVRDSGADGSLVESGALGWGELAHTCIYIVRRG
mmetsp:Transcript_9567/g.27127  ORF Transcript_9567/g.27127 Transcript_9567/m.27127 type:complete len:229 (-) Transcript_9567:114-800(-)